MPASNTTMIHKLQTAINQKGGIILLDKTQFYSDEQERPVTIYKVCTKNFETGKKEVLFSSPATIQIVLYLRDYLFWIEGKEIPVGNEMWDEIKKQKGIVFSKKEDFSNGRNKERE